MNLKQDRPSKNVNFLAKSLMVLKSDVIKKKKHVQKFNVRNHVTQELQEIGVWFNMSAMQI